MTSRYFYLILLLYINLHTNKAEVQTALKMMTPIINTKFYVLCDITVSTGAEDVVFFSYPIIIEDKNLACKITDWRYCNQPAPSQINGACGCSSKKVMTSGVWQYRFYLLINPVTLDFVGSQFICQLHTVKDSRQMEIVTFTRFPDRLMYTCKNTSILFDWEFTPIRESISSRFHIVRISWTAIGQSGKGTTRFLGTYYLTDDGKDRFNNDGNTRSLIQYETGRMPQLMITNLQLSDSKQAIRINVTFNLTRMLGRNKRFIPMNVSEFLSVDFKHNDTGDYDETTDLYEVFDFSTTSTTTTTTTTTTRLTTTVTSRASHLTTTTPMPLEVELDNPENHLLDTACLFVTEPPSGETRVTIKAYQSITGNLVITCQVHHMAYPGEPPVNVTIWHDEKSLITRSGITILHYSTAAEGKIISCGLQGHALDCLPDADPRVLRVTFDLKDLQKSGKPLGGVDLLLSLYAWESIVCLVLVFWVISLLLDHILFVVRKARKDLERANEDLLNYERQRREYVEKINSVN